jgi:HSP20 family protein
MTPQSVTAMQPAKTTVLTKRSEPREIFSRMERIHDLIQRRAFEIFDRGGRFLGRDLSDWFQAEAELLHPVHLEIEELDEALKVWAEVPGFAAKELDIHVEPRRLTIAGKHEHKKEENKNGKTIYSELCAEEILRTIALPSTVEPSKVTAELKDGILSIELPKVASTKSVRVEAKNLN